MRAARRPGLRWVFLTSTTTRPTGGDIALFELLNAIARGGRGQVQLVHTPFRGSRVRSLDDLPWMAFDPSVQHRFAASLDPDEVPDGDVIVYTLKVLAEAVSPGLGSEGQGLIDALAGASGRSWVPILFLQGLGVFAPEVEDLAVGLPGAKVGVSTWLADHLIQRGVAAADVVCIPNGVDPSSFRITKPIDARSPHVTMNFDPHPVKGGEVGLEAMAGLYQDLGVRSTVFGTRAPERALAPGLEFVASPDRGTLVERLYNGSSLFLQPSRQEGFGMCAVEAMACGCALVATANGGSAEYAHDGETALVCGPEPEDMADALGRLVRDDALRRRLAVNGAHYVERFRWSTSALAMERFATKRVADRADPQ